MTRPPKKRRGCVHCHLIYSSASGDCPLCGKTGTENLRNWQGSMPPTMGRGNGVWTPSK